MTIQERLRGARWVQRKGQIFENPEHQTMLEAAQTIDEQANEIERLYEELKNMSCSCEGECYYKYKFCPHRMAANALKPK